MKALLIAGLGFGDEGKGSIVDYLSRQHSNVTVVRYNGGPQAAHNVVTDEGTHHVFSQFGSGSLVPGVRSHLSRFMLVEPFAFYNERQALIEKGASVNITVDPDCIVITPFHWLANKIRETQRGDTRHGSCGFGVGEARRLYLESGPVLRVRDLLHGALAYQKILYEIKEHYMYEFRYRSAETELYFQHMRSQQMKDLVQQYDWFANTVRVRHLSPDDDATLIFEGAQGVLLDENHGFQPHTTWTNCTFENAVTLLEPFERKLDSVEKIGVLRTYMTRHGAGPFPSEDAEVQFPDHNGTGQWQGKFRQGFFDPLLYRYAIKCLRHDVDCLALTHVDRIQPEFRYVDHYLIAGEQYPGWGVTTRTYEAIPEDIGASEPSYGVLRSESTEHAISSIEGHLQIPVKYVSRGPRASDKAIRQSTFAGRFATAYKRS